MDRKAKWLVVAGTILTLMSIGMASASASAQDGARHHGPMQAFSDPNWQPGGQEGSSVKSMRPFSDLNWRPSIQTGPVGQSEPVGGGTDVPVIALIAALTSLAAGIGAFAGTLRFKRLRVTAGS
jgi:hypothetical protein